MFAKVRERIDSSAAKVVSRPGGSGGGNGGDRSMPSIVSRDMRVCGNLDTPGEVHVEGTVDGDINCAKLTIGATGIVNGHIVATTVRVHGQVRGEIDAEEVFILNGSSVTGDVMQRVLEIAPGASFEGAIRRRPAPAPTAMLAAPTEEAVAVGEATDVTDEGEPLLLDDDATGDAPASEEPMAEATTMQPASLSPQPANSGDDMARQKAG